MAMLKTTAAGRAKPRLHMGCCMYMCISKCIPMETDSCSDIIHVHALVLVCDGLHLVSLSPSAVYAVLGVCGLPALWRWTWRWEDCNSIIMGILGLSSKLLMIQFLTTQLWVVYNLEMTCHALIRIWNHAWVRWLSSHVQQLSHRWHAVHEGMSHVSVFRKPLRSHTRTQCMTQSWIVKNNILLSLLISYTPVLESNCTKHAVQIFRTSLAWEQWHTVATFASC